MNYGHVGENIPGRGNGECKGLEVGTQAAEACGRGRPGLDLKIWSAWFMFRVLSA